MNHLHQSPIKNTVLNILLAISSVLLITGLLELGLRQVPSKLYKCPSWIEKITELRKREPGIYINFNPQINYASDLLTPIPETLTLDGLEGGELIIYLSDENGFKNPPGLYNSKKQFDVFVVGDSFAAARSVSLKNSWYSILAAKSKLSIYSAGIGGNGPYQSLEVLKKYGQLKNPKIIIWGFFANDFIDSIRAKEVCNPTLNEVIPKHLIDQVNCDQFDYYKNGTIENFEQAKKVLDAYLIGSGEHITFEQKIKLFIKKLNLYSLYLKLKVKFSHRSFLKNNNPFAPTDLELNLGQNALDHAIEIADSIGAKFLMTYFPSADQIYGDDFQVGFENNLRRQALKNYAQDKGIYFIDFTDIFQDSHNPYSFYFYNECQSVYGHFNQKGNKKVGVALTNYILEHKLMTVNK